MVILCVGMIASGKGEFCKLMAKQGAIIVNDDDIVKAVHAGDYSLYKKQNKEIYKQIELTIILSSLSQHLDVVIDRPNFRRSTRQRYISMAGIFETPVIAVQFKKEHPLIHAERRYQCDPRGLPLDHWIDAASRHHAEWECPRIEEGLDNIIPADTAIEMARAGNL